MAKLLVENKSNPLSNDNVRILYVFAVLCALNFVFSVRCCWVHIWMICLGRGSSHSP